MQKKKEFLINFLYYSFVVITVLVAIKYLLGPLSPFITAFIIVSACRKIIIKLEDISHSKMFTALIFTLFTVSVLSLAVYGIFFGITGELTSLSESISEESVSALFSLLKERLTAITGMLPSFGITDRLSDFLMNELRGADNISSGIISRIVPPLVSAAMKFFSFFPTAVIFLCFMFIAMFYISIDYDRICSFITMQLPDRVLDTVDETKSIIFTTAKELFKSYILLTSITFLQLLTGFRIIGIRYSLLPAVLICIIDILPILGTGTILIPWAAVCLLLGDMRTGISLLVLYGVIVLFRRIAEPKIVGTSTGLPPLIALISIFIGLKLLGFKGIIVAPIIAVTIISLNQKEFIKLYKTFPQKNDEKIIKTRQKFINFKKNDSHDSQSFGGD